MYICENSIMDVSKIIEDINIHLRRFFLNIFFIMIFWCIPILLFKPELFESPLYVQFALIFCLSLVWFIVNFPLLGTIIVTFFRKHQENHIITLELCSLVSVFSLSIFILIGYYYSYSLTAFLRNSFFHILLLDSPFTLSTLLFFFMKKLKKTK